MCHGMQHCHLWLHLVDAAVPLYDSIKWSSSRSACTVWPRETGARVPDSRLDTPEVATGDIRLADSVQSSSQANPPFARYVLPPRHANVFETKCLKK